MFDTLLTLVENPNVPMLVVYMVDVLVNTCLVDYLPTLCRCCTAFAWMLSCVGALLWYLLGPEMS